MEASSPAQAMAADFVEVCFPAWPTRRSLASPPIAFSDRVGLAPLGAAAFVAFAVAVPGTIALVSVVMLTFLLAFVLLAPFAMMLLAWGCWRHDCSSSEFALRRPGS